MTTVQSVTLNTSVMSLFGWTFIISNRTCLERADLINNAAQQGSSKLSIPGQKIPAFCLAYKGKDKGKAKGHVIKGQEGPEGEQMNSSTLPSTSSLNGVGGQRHAPTALPTGKTRYPLYRKLGGPQGRSGLVRKISTPPEFEPRTVQPVWSRYTDWAIPAPLFGI
jgi:hypothetical protein